MSTKKKPTLYITALLGGLVMAYLLFIFLPGQKRTAELRDELRMKQDFIGQASLAQENIRTAVLKLGTVQQFVRDSEGRFPRDNQWTALYGEINGRLEQTGAKPARFDPQARVAWEQLAQQPLAVGLQGSFQQTFAFLKELESLPQLIWVDELQIKATEKAGQALQCELTMAIFTVSNDFSD